MNAAEQKSHDMSHGWKPINTAPKDKFVLLACPSGYTTTPWVFTTGILHSDYKVGRWVDHANDDLNDWGMSPIFWRDDIVTPDSATPAPAPAVPQGWTFSISDDDDGTWLRVKSPGGREAALSAVNGGLAHDNRRSIASRVLLELKEALAATPALATSQEPAVPQGYEIHEIPADYSGLVWLEGQVRAVARRAQAATGPQGWTDADSDAARLALELECLLMDTKDLSVVSKWWGSASDALELHRQRLAATPAPAHAQEEVGLILSAEDVHAAFTKNFPKSRISQAWINFAADIAQAIAARAAKPAQDAGLTDHISLLEEVASSLEDYKNDAPWGSWDRERLERLYAIIAALRAKGHVCK